MRGPFSILSLATLATLYLSGLEAVAYVTGDGGCFGCNVEAEPIASALEKSFAQTDVDILARQSWAGTICDHHPCANDFGVVDEGMARDLLDVHLARRDAWWQKLAIWVGIAVASLSLIVSFLALRQTSRNERDIGRLQQQAGEKQSELA